VSAGILTVGVVPKSTRNPYFEDCRLGAQEAAEELGFNLSWDGPPVPDAHRQAQIVESWASDRIPVIAVSVESRTTLSPVLKQARARGTKILTWDSDGEQKDVDYMADALQTLDPPVVGMLSMFSPTYRCARAVEAAEMTGDDVTVVGFDFEPETLSYMQSGFIKATHAQRQYYFGYMVPYVLYSMKVLGASKTMDILGSQMVDESRFNAGIDVVKADQVDDYNAFLDSLGIGG